MKDSIIEYLENGLKIQEELDKKFPNRHKAIHKDCCKNRPSSIGRINGTIDPESEEIKTYPKEIIAREFLFVCAWRPNKLCKGNCDNMGIDEKYIQSLSDNK